MGVSMNDSTSKVPVPVRIADTDWQEFRAIHGRAAAEAVRRFIAWSLRRTGAVEPARPAEGTAACQLVPAALIDQFAAWYLRQPGAELPGRPGAKTTMHMFKIPRADWQEFHAFHGGKASEAIKMFIAWTLRRPGAELPLQVWPPDQDG
jgi:hypothetical protein